MATAKKSTTRKTETKDGAKRAAPKPTEKLELRVLAFRISPKAFAALEAFCEKNGKTKTDAVVEGLVRIGALTKEVTS